MLKCPIRFSTRPRISPSGTASPGSIHRFRSRRKRDRPADGGTPEGKGCQGQLEIFREILKKVPDVEPEEYDRL